MDILPITSQFLTVIIAAIAANLMTALLLNGVSEFFYELWGEG